MASAEDGADASTAGDAPAVEVRNLHKRFGSGESAVTAVDDVSFRVEPGTVVGLLGPNGAGKTTTIKSLLGLVLPDEGSVRVDGVDVLASPSKAYARVGAMLEGARNVYWRLTVRENLRFFAALGGRRPGEMRERHDQLLRDLDLADRADDPVKELSRGMKGKVSLACTLARDVPVVFLDEPTLGLDVESSLDLRRELRRLAERESMTILLSSHDMDVVEDVCDRVIVMNDGRVVADDPVEELIELFRTQSYRITTEERLPADLRADLEREFTVEAWGEAAGGDRFTVSLPDSDAFYDLIDRLRTAEVALSSVDSVEPDLEEVFLQLTNGEGEPAATPTNSGTLGGDRA